MDFGAPIANSINVNPNQAVQTLSGLLSLKQQQQALQTGAFQQQSAQAQAQQEQQTARQRSGLANFMSTFDPTKHIGPDGTLDLDSVLTDPKLRQSAGDQFPDIVDKMVGIKQHQLQAKQQLANLNDSVRAQFMTTLGGLRTDPDVVQDTPQGRQKVGAAIEQFGATGPDAARIAQIYAPMVEHAPPGKLVQGVSTAQLQAMDAAAQAGRQAPSFADTGSALQNINPQAAGGNLTGQPPIPRQLPPQIVTNPTTGGQGVVGGPTGTNPRPIGGPAGASNSWQPYAGQQNDIRAFQQEVQGTRSAADTAPTARNINAQILRLADNAKTGPGTEVWQHAVGALAAPFGLSPTANYQELGKFLEKNAIQNMQSMGGPPSDARLSAAAAANGSTHFSPEALKAVTKFNDATNTALMQYRQGLDRSVGMGQNVDYTKLPAFKAAWAKNFDVDVFRVENAIRDGDKAELAKIKSELGPEKLKALAQKRANLNALSEGQVPP